jgi:hypothetical protein
MCVGRRALRVFRTLDLQSLCCPSSVYGGRRVVGVYVWVGGVWERDKGRERKRERKKERKKESKKERALISWTNKKKRKEMNEIKNGEEYMEKK